MRIEAAGAEQLQQIQQLKQLAEQLISQPQVQDNEQGQEETVRLSRTPKEVSLENQLSATQKKLVADIWSVVNSDPGTLLSNSEGVEAFAELRGQLEELSENLTAGRNKNLDQFGANVESIRESFVEDAENIEDARANYGEESNQISKFRSKYVTDNQNVAEFQEDFREDGQNIQSFQANFREDANSLSKFQNNFVQDSKNVAAEQANFVEDKQNGQSAQATFVEDHGNVQRAQQQFSAQKSDLNAFEQNFSEDLAKIESFQAESAEHRAALQVAGQRYAHELNAQPTFRQTFDAHVDEIGRLQELADQQKGQLEARAELTPKAESPRTEHTPIPRQELPQTAKPADHSAPTATQLPSSHNLRDGNATLEGEPVPDSKVARAANQQLFVEPKAKGDVDTPVAVSRPEPAPVASDRRAELQNIDEEPSAVSRQTPHTGEGVVEPSPQPKPPSPSLPAPRSSADDQLHAANLIAQQALTDASAAWNDPARDSTVASLLAGNARSGSQFSLASRRDDRDPRSDERRDASGKTRPEDQQVAE